MTKVSVLMPTYNQSNYLGDAINSVINQTFNDFELIILDNCSTDDTSQVVQKFASDKRVKYYKNEVNIGNIGNFNEIIKFSQGEYIKYLFSDDLLEPSALEEFVKILDENPDVSLATSFFELFGSLNFVQRQPLVGKTPGYEVIKKTVMSGNWIGAPSNVIFRKSDMNGLEFKKRWQWWTDLELWHQLLMKGDLYVIPKVLSKFREHTSSATSSCISNYKHIQDGYYYLKYIRDHNLYAPLKDDVEFKLAIKRNAIKWIRLIPIFYRNKNYFFLLKGLKIMINENLVKESIEKLFKILLGKVRREIV